MICCRSKKTKNKDNFILRKFFAFTCLSFSALSQGEMVVARFNTWPPPELPRHVHGDLSLSAYLYFGDGSQKMLAAMSVWIALLLVWKRHGPECLKDSLVQVMLESFLRIPTTIKASETMASSFEATLTRIANQNVSARVQPISTFQWSCILQPFLNGGSGMTFDAAVAAYNSHPVVLAHDRNESGAGCVALDGRKKQGVKHFVERCVPDAYQVILNSTHDLPFLLGAFGENFAYNSQCFLNSKANLEGQPTTPLDGPLPGESFVEAVVFNIFHPKTKSFFLKLLKTLFDGCHC